MSEISLGIWLFVFFAVIFASTVAYGFMVRNRQAKKAQTLISARTTPLPGWQEGETTRLLTLSEHFSALNVQKQLLNKLETLLYHRLKEALPECVIVPHVHLNDLFKRPDFSTDGSETQSKIFQRLAILEIGFVACSADMKVLALFDTPSPPPVSDSRRAERLLSAKKTAIKMLRIPCVPLDPKAPPSVEAIREIVFPFQGTENTL
ncbi:MAG: DUF2726 domain-containing protein [Burkholderiales bacterium]|jgi:hypothetical protein|nr:DUF2726 domain-containing protein [Burkholderiales bacterium]